MIAVVKKISSIVHVVLVCTWCYGKLKPVVKYHDASFLGASAGWMPSVSSVLVAEAEACRGGLRLALQST
jgi:hypothetical protein